VHTCFHTCRLAGKKKRERARSAFEGLQSHVDTLTGLMEQYHSQRRLLRETGEFF
jgi:hypothetical protein